MSRTAEQALNGMEQVFRAEMTRRGRYIEGEITNPERAAAGAVCGGRRACAIGALWLGYGVEYEVTDDPYVGPIVELPGTDQDRHEFVSERPELERALAALNEAANEYLNAHEDVNPNTAHYDEIEQLFEAHKGPDGYEPVDATRSVIPNEDMLAVIARAREMLA